VEPTTTQADLKRSVLIYLVCVTALFGSLATVVNTAPPAPEGEACDGVSRELAWDLIPMRSGNTAAIITLWKCATAYQAQNWWFVLALYELVFLGLKSFALPISFALSILGGAIFQFPLSQLLVSLGETLGSTICYLLASVIAKPILEHFVPQKVASFRKRAHEERDHMFLFNIFLRLSPFPNWLVNCSSPIVGNPLGKFAAGTFCGTFFPVMLLGRCGYVLRTVGEEGFDVAKLTKQNFPFAAALAMMQFLPLYIIRLKKQAAEGKGNGKGKKAN